MEGPPVSQFCLDDDFVRRYVGKQPKWGPLGYVTYKRTYARDLDKVKERHRLLGEQAGLTRNEEWWLTLVRVVEGTYSIQQRHCEQLRLPWDGKRAQRSAQEMFKLMWDFKFLPPGRGLWMMGTDYVDRAGGGSLNNPLDENTRILTREHGWTTLKNVEGQTVHVLTSTKLYGREHNSVASSPKWVEAKISTGELQPCLEIEFVDDFKQRRTIVASENHRWFRKETTKSQFERVTTLDLKEGDIVPIVLPRLNVEMTRFGQQHGLFFGDGTRSNGLMSQFTDSIHLVEDLFDPRDVVRKDGRVDVVGCPLAWGRLPTEEQVSDRRYLLGFLAGYFAADGTISEKFGGPSLASARREELEAVRGYFELLGIRATEVRGGLRESNFGEGELYFIKLNKHDLWPEFFLKKSHREKYVSHMASVDSVREKNRAMVKSVRLVGERRVLCATVPYYEQFVTEGFILTSNCAFVSTSELAVSFSSPFCFLMDMSMLGVGVGGDTRGAGRVIVREPEPGPEMVVEDTREGWVDLVRRVLEAYVGNDTLPSTVDYSRVRPAGSPIRGFGGTASGPEPLRELVASIREILDARVGKKIKSSDIVDLFNVIGRCVVAGNVRRSAEIMFGDPDDTSFLELKDRKKHPRQTDAWRWASNNSIFAEVGQDYSAAAAKTAENGEPGYMWLENARRFSRMGRAPDFRDMGASGGNPCLVGSTLVAVADGRNAVRIDELVGQMPDVYTVRNGKVTIAKASRVWKTRENAEVWRLTLDDGSVLRLTPDHLVMLRDGTYRPVSELTPGTSLMPFNSYRNHNYRQISSNTGRDRRQYRMIAEHNGLIVDPKTTAIHHRNFNSLDDTLDNLVPLPHSEHRELHASRMCGDLNPMRDPEVAARAHANRDKSGPGNPMFGRTHASSSVELIGKKSRENWLRQHDYMVESIKEGMTAEARALIGDSRRRLYPRSEWKCPVCPTVLMLTQRQADNRTACSRSCANVLRHNHKVVSVEFDGYEDVYDMTVPETNNFGVVTSGDERHVTSSGIFVHNCLEQTLESFELCCLVETFPSRHASYEEFERTLKFAYLYAKTVTLVPTHDPRTNAVLLRNRRIGTSQSGIVQAMKRHGRREFFRWCDLGYDYLQKLDTVYSRWLCVPTSVKTTSVKPSGTTSLLPGVTPGIHYPESEYYYRVIRFANDSPIVPVLRGAGHECVVLDPAKEPNTTAVYFPVREEYYDRSVREVSMWEQLEIAAQVQEHWADNQVSVTVKFHKETEGPHIVHALELYETRLKGVSFLPHDDHGYEHAPYQPITREAYEEAVSLLRPYDLNSTVNEVVDKFCDGDKCEVKFT